MLLGPVFQAELLRTARRRRYYVLRFLYGLLLLFIIWAGYEGETSGSSTVTIDVAARFALNTFLSFAVIQLITILLMIPALFGGSIADEKQRKTLHYLMASQLSSFEIVIDKVLGRAPHVAVFLVLGLPVVCLLGLVGGVPPEYVLVAYVGTFSTASMAVCMTVLISTLSRKVRQAVLVSYVLLLAWVFVPVIVYGAGSRLYPVTYSWIEPVNTWIGATSPLYVYAESSIRTNGLGAYTAYVVEQFAWMVGLQLGVSIGFLLLAVWRLRPAFRRHEATQPRRKWFGEGKKARKARKPRWWDRPECGLDAMAWKERYFASGSDVFTKMVVLPATIAVSVLLVLASGIDESLIRAFSRLWELGLRGWGGGGDEIVTHFRVVSAWYVAIWLLAVAGSSASSVAVEREEDTWISLTSTPLTGWEIVRGKVLGAVWAQRGFAAVPLAFWTLGLLTGSVHLLGFLATLVTFAVVTWLVVAVGVHASLRAPSTSKAIASTIGTLAVLYGYPIFLLSGFLNSYEWGRYYVTFVGLPPRVVVGPLASYHYVGELWRTTLQGRFFDLQDATSIVFGLFLLAAYAIIAGALTYRTVGRFDRWLDRPSLSRDGRSAIKPVKVEEIEAVLQS